MSDGFKGAAQLVSEAVVKPVVDEVGKMVEEGVQSVTGSQKTDPQKKSDSPDPHKIAQDDAVKKKQAWANIQKFNQQYTQQAQQLQQQRMKEAQEKQQVEVQKNHEVRQFEFAKKQKENEALRRQQTRSERKGAGGG